MSYLETLNSHNTQIQNLINKANGLPEAGGDGSSFPYSITVTNNMGFLHNIFYDNANIEAIVTCSGALGAPRSLEFTGCQLKAENGIALNLEYCYIHLYNFTGNATVNLIFDNPYG